MFLRDYVETSINFIKATIVRPFTCSMPKCIKILQQSGQGLVYVCGNSHVSHCGVLTTFRSNERFVLVASVFIRCKNNGTRVEIKMATWHSKEVHVSIYTKSTELRELNMTSCGHGRRRSIRGLCLPRTSLYAFKPAGVHFNRAPCASHQCSERS